MNLVHHRMEIVARDNNMETHANLNRTDYIKSPDSIEDVSKSVWSHQLEGAPTKTWVMVLTGAVTLSVSAVALLVITITGPDPAYEIGGAGPESSVSVS